MAESQDQDYAALTKKAWIVYYLLAVVVAALLVLFVARDAEEQFFYGIMTIAGSYVLRPGDKQMGKLIQKFTGVAPPASED